MKQKHISQIDYGHLEELGRVITIHNQIEEKERELSVPTFNNLDDLAKLHMLFKAIVAELPLESQPDLRAEKRLFLFIALYLYAPSALAGRKVERGMRIALAQSMGFSSCRAITYHCNGLGMWSNTYPDFKHVLNYIFSQLVVRAKE